MTRMRSLGIVLTVLWTGVQPLHGAEPAGVPDDFPKFVVPGYEQPMATLRALYWRHYEPVRAPLATLWDEWITGPMLWPAVTTGDRSDQLRRSWARGLSQRRMDPEGYVASHQHVSIAHQDGWPFPFWRQGGEGTWGWHYSLRSPPHNWHLTKEVVLPGWDVGAIRNAGDAWELELPRAGASIRSPELSILPDQSPFIQLRWRAEGLETAQPYLEWTTELEPEFSPEKRFYFAPAAQGRKLTYEMIPVYRSPAWKGRITRIGVNFDNPPGAKVGLQAIFTQYDTRHDINNPCYVLGCCEYFWWTRDLNFLRDNVQKMRLALRYCMVDLGGLEHKCIVVPWVGHDGRSGIERKPDGTKVIHSGRGIGHNYWDLLPAGYEDIYATIRYYDALRHVARLEREIGDHPEWNIPAGPVRLAPDALLAHAADVKASAGSRFWNDATGRFTCGIDVDGKSYDYGYTFINCEAIYYDFATPDQAESIMQWLTGERIVEGDTSQGADIYHWRFAPRASTKRNIEWYGWFWSAPESIAFGDQVQDGGAVLGFSYHDLMARLKTRGPDDAWARLREIIAWYDEVQTAGGYRAYYGDGTWGKLQGGGTAGGLGLDMEFFESILVPQVVLDGFLGFAPRGDGFEIDPRLPGDWPELTVTRIRLHRLTLDVAATRQQITIAGQIPAPQMLQAYLPAGTWQIDRIGADAKKLSSRTVTIASGGEGTPVRFEPGVRIVLTRGR